MQAQNALGFVVMSSTSATAVSTSSSHGTPFLFALALNLRGLLLRLART